jgi:hypothetical protein
MVRAAIASHITFLEKAGFPVFSVTTDGWVTSASPPQMEAIDKRTGVIRRIVAARELLTNKGEYLELKHTCEGLVNFTVRGQYSCSDDGTPTIKAMTGFQSAP